MSNEITIHVILDDPAENRMSDTGISGDPSGQGNVRQQVFWMHAFCTACVCIRNVKMQILPGFNEIKCCKIKHNKNFPYITVTIVFFTSSEVSLDFVKRLESKTFRP